MLIRFIGGLRLMVYKRISENREDHQQDSWCGQLSQVLTFSQDVIFGTSIEYASHEYKAGLERH